MKRLIADAYSRIRTKIDHRIDAIAATESIVRYGDHYVYERMMKPGRVAIDLGANRGHFSEKIARAFKPAIYLVEANLSLLDAINIPSAIKVNAAITSTNSEMTFFVSSNPEASSLDQNIAAQYGIVEERKVECITFATMLSKYNITDIALLKVDIEGAELDLFASMKNEEILLCQQIAVEFHDFMLPGTLPAIEKTVARLANLGYAPLKFSPLDWRRVLFVKMDHLIVAPSFFRKLGSVLRRSYLLDYWYYRVLLRLKSVFSPKKS